MNNQKRRLRSVIVNDRGQIVIPEDMRKNMDIKEADTLILIERDGEIIVKKEEDIISAVGEDEFWRVVFRASLIRAWEKEDEVWDEIARKDIHG